MQTDPVIWFTPFLAIRIWLLAIGKIAIRYIPIAIFHIPIMPHRTPPVACAIPSTIYYLPSTKYQLTYVIIIKE